MVSPRHFHIQGTRSNQLLPQLLHTHIHYNAFLRGHRCLARSWGTCSIGYDGDLLIERMLPVRIRPPTGTHDRRRPSHGLDLSTHTDPDCRTSQSEDKTNTVFAAVRNPQSSAKLLALKKSAPNVHIIKADLSDADSWQASLYLPSIRSSRRGQRESFSVADE